MRRIRNDIDNKHTHTHTHPIRLLSVYLLLPVNSPIAVIVEYLNTVHQCGKGGLESGSLVAHSTSEMSRQVHHVRTQALYSSTFIPKPTTYSRTPTECRTALQPHASVPRTRHPRTRHPRSSTAGWRGETCRGRSHTASHSSHRAP